MRITTLAMALAAITACGDNGSKGADPDASTPAPDAPDSPVPDAAAPPDAALPADARPAVCGNGEREDGEECDDGNQTPGDGCESCRATDVVPTAFKVTSLDLLDPHVMAEDAGCRSADLTSFVNQLVAATFMDADRDGFLDFAPVMVFRPLSQADGTTPADFVVATCSATSPTTCSAGAATPIAYTATSQAAATCLGALDGTTGGYTPPVAATPGPCFATDERTLSLSLSAIQVTLEKARIAATYDGAPATRVTGGLLRGFMTEAVAEATQIEALGTSLAALLPGSRLNGCPSDLDVVDGVRGWWFYLGFTAEEVTWTQ